MTQRFLQVRHDFLYLFICGVFTPLYIALKTNKSNGPFGSLFIFRTLNSMDIDL